MRALMNGPMAKSLFCKNFFLKIYYVVITVHLQN